MAQNMKLNYLKVKIKELAGEGKIIREDEIKADRKYKQLKTRRALYKQEVDQTRLLRRALIGCLDLKKCGFENVVYHKWFFPYKSVDPKEWTVNVPNPPKPDWINYQHQLKCNLKEHRKTVVRGEVRATLIAYGFLRGKDFRFIEKNTDLRTIHPTRTVYGFKLWKDVERNVSSFTNEEVYRAPGETPDKWLPQDRPLEPWRVKFYTWRDYLFEGMN